MRVFRNNPWAWVPTLYIFEGLPYFIVNTISLAIFKDMGVANGPLGAITTLISLPWLIKPFWSPFVDIFRSKRWWILSMQFLMVVSVCVIAAILPVCAFGIMLCLFTVLAFASATHDIAADGFYMIALDERRQSAFIGIRNTFYRVASVFGQGALLVLAGILQRRMGIVGGAWSVVLITASVILALISFWHLWSLPLPEEDKDRRATRTGREILAEFGQSFSSFFRKKGVGVAILFMLLFRLPEALSLNMLYPFFKDSADLGGLGLGAEEYGLVYGTFGTIALLAGGITGGVLVSRTGLRRVLWPMTLSLTLPCAVYLYMAVFRPESLWTIGGCIVLDQFGYGFGFTAYTLFMMQFVDGPLKTSHYAICTAFMWLSMKLPGLVSGYIQQALGYVGFFTLVMVSCLLAFLATAIVRRQNHS